MRSSGTRTDEENSWTVFRRVGLWCILLAAAACAQREPGLRAYTFQGETMGTTYTVKVVAGDLGEEEQADLGRRIQSALEDVNAKMSHYRPDSELSRFNRFCETTPFPISRETFEVFREALEISDLTRGAFDVTVGPLVDAWGFGPRARPEVIPSDEEIADLRKEVGYDKLELDPESSTIRKTEPAIRCDLSAIAKGYGVDKVAEALDDAQMGDYMVEVGGEVRTRGSNDKGQSWRIGIERPVSEGRVIQQVISLSGWGMATSGDYRNYYEVDGVRYSHLIDPRTGRPIAHRLASVSVIDERCARADGLATALLVLGPEEGYAVAAENDLAALFMVKDDEEGFRERATPAFDRVAERR